MQFKNLGFSSSKCQRPECQLNDLTTDSEHIVYDRVFASSILYFIKDAYKKEKFSYNLDEFFYLFPYLWTKNYKLSLELFVLFTQIKMTAFQVCLEDRFATWNFNHFYVQLLKILRKSIEICDLYSISISILHSLLEYTEFAALGLLHEYIYDYARIHGISNDL